MKDILITVLCLLIASFLFGQEKEIKKAIHSTSRSAFFTDVSFDKYYKQEKVEKAVKKLGYEIHESQTAMFEKFGSPLIGYTEMSIINPANKRRYLAHLQEEERKRIARRKKQDEMLGRALGKFGKWYTKEVEKGRSSFRGSSSNSASNNSSKCYEIGKWTKTGITTSNYDDEQEIKCLKNSYTHKIYSKDENSNYYVLKTIGYEIFGNYEDALNYILKEELYCQCN